jgi:4-hydroxy-tetrahydrodipicolinate synthase
MPASKQFGLSCALALPLESSFAIDLGRLVAHARRCLDAGCSSLTIFGTTGEGASVSLGEREQILDALANGGIQMGQIIAGVTSSVLEDAVAQAQLVVDRGCRGALVAPPFYFKDVTEDGLYDWFSRFCEKLDEEQSDIFLYHIPSVTAAPLSIRLIGRLKENFSKTIKGVKDSGSDLSYTETLLKTHNDLFVLIGNERHLAAGVRLGAQGAISGLANLWPEILLPVMETGMDDSRIARLATEILKFQAPTAIKVLLAHRDNDPAWSTVRPPLVKLSKAETTSLIIAWDQIRFQASAG